MSKKQIAVCSYCKSTDVMADAYAYWNVDAQRWEVEQTFDKGGYCTDCDGETSIDMVDYDHKKHDVPV